MAPHNNVIKPRHFFEQLDWFWCLLLFVFNLDIFVHDSVGRTGLTFGRLW